MMPGRVQIALARVLAEKRRIGTVLGMSYPTKLLTDNEDVKLDVHPHWSALWPVVWPSLVLGALTILLADTGRLHGPVSIAVLVVWALALLWSGLKLANYYATDFVVTSMRIIFRHGLIQRSEQGIPLDQVTNTSVMRGILERVLGNGTLVVESAGKDSKEYFNDIAHTDQVQRLILSLMEGRVARTSGGGAPAGADVAGQLERLIQMHNDGKLSDAEFAKAKDRVVGQ